MQLFFCHPYIIHAHLQNVNTLKHDVKSFNQLLLVMKDLVRSETNEVTVDYYRKIIFSTNKSTVAVNNLVSATFTNTACLNTMFIVNC